jgi:hypothetical protein
MSSPPRKITIIPPTNYDPNYVGPHVPRPNSKSQKKFFPQTVNTKNAS